MQLYDGDYRFLDRNPFHYWARTAGQVIDKAVLISITSARGVLAGGHHAERVTQRSRQVATLTAQVHHALMIAAENKRLT